MRRGEVWLAHVGGKRRPVLVLTRSEVLDVRRFVTVAEITSSMRGLAAEVPIDHVDVGLDGDCAVNCDGLHTVGQSILTDLVGELPETDMQKVCAALAYAVGC